MASHAGTETQVQQKSWERKRIPSSKSTGAEHLTCSAYADVSFRIQKATLEAQLFEYCVKLRNTRISEKMRQKYFNMTRDPSPLPTFFVSNSG